MSTTLVSIVLPTHNGQRYLEESFRSCVAQTYPNWELIIVDDASTDETPEMIQRLVASDPRVRTVRNEQNRKLPASLNIGLGLARGEYLTWTSDDNYYHPEALQAMVEVLDATSTVDIVYADYFRLDPETGATKLFASDEPSRLVEYNVVGACFLYRRAVHQRLEGYDTRLFTAEDYDYWLRASLYFRFYHLQRPLYFYREHAASLSSRFPEQVQAAVEQTLAANLPHMTWLTARERALGYMRLAKIAHYWRSDRRAAWRYLFTALRCDVITVITKTRPRALLEILLGTRGAKRDQSEA